MRIACVGGGPGGLFFASLIRRARPDAEVTVFERNPPDATFGFGVVFSDRTLSGFGDADAELTSGIAASAVRWDDIEVRLRGTVVRCGGHGFSAIARRRLLAILQARARAAGAKLVFDHEVRDLRTAEYDVVVACDGVNSSLRREAGQAFGTQDRIGAARYIWFATPQPFDALTFLFEESEHGVFSVHAYPFDEKTSTFIVETDEASWRRAGLEDANARAQKPGESDLAGLAYCEKLFARHLGGHGLLANNSKWLNFHAIRNQRWHRGNVVLLGDAAHTAHFSVGSGTKMAMEDAVSLAAALRAHDRAGDAFAAYEAERRPLVERIQAAAAPSQRWWETFGVHARLPPEQFAFHFLTRSPILSYGSLRARDPRFVRRVERWFAAGTKATTEEAASALFTRAEVAGLSLPSRIAVIPTRPGPAGPLATEEDLVQLGGYALCGAGLVLAAAEALPGGGGGRAWSASWRKVTDFIHRRSAARIGLRLPAGDLAAARLAEDAGFDLVLAVPGSATGAGALLDAVGKLRAALAPERCVACELSSESLTDGSPEAEGLVALARRLREAGCGLASVAVAGGGRGGLPDLWLSDRIRLEAGLATLAVAPALRPEDAHAAVLSGRADLVASWPIPLR